MKNISPIILSLLLAISSSAIAFADDTLKVGMTLPLSGGVAAMGQSFQRGVTLFSEKFPEDAAKIKVVLDDHRYDGKLASASCSKLSSVDKVQLIVAWGNTPSSICGPIAERLKTPALLVSMQDEAKGKKYVLTIGPRQEGSIKLLSDYFKNLNAKHPAAVTIDIGSAVEGVNKTKDQLGGNMLVKLVPATEGDFKTIIASLKQQGVDALLLFLMPEQAVIFAKQSVDLGFKVPMVGGDIFADDAFQKNFTKILPSLAFVYGAVEQSFVEESTKRFGDGSYIYETASGYTVMQLLSRLQKLIAKEHPQDLIQAFRKIDLAGTPTLLSLTDEADFGLHLETSPKLYTAKKE